MFTLEQLKQSIDRLCNKVSSLEKTITLKDKRIDELEQRVNELEAFTNESKRYSLKNNVIIRGLPVTKPHQSYAEAANAPAPEEIGESQIEPIRTSSSATSDTDGSLGSQSSKPSRPSHYRAFQSIRDEVIGFIDRSMGLHLEKEDIVAAHELKKGRNDAVPPLIVRFAFTSIKQDIMEEFRKRRLFKQKIYINDQLTTINNTIFYHARSLVKNNTIQSAWTRLGKIYIRQTAHDKPVWVQKLSDLPKSDLPK